MNNIIYYLKYLSIFAITELGIIFITSALNLIGVNSGISQIIIFGSNITLFFILNFRNAKNKQKKGYIEGILMGLILILFMFIIKLILIGKSINTVTLLYYFILLLVSILGGILGGHKKSND